jgi:hypothetical protein
MAQSQVAAEKVKIATENLDTGPSSRILQNMTSAAQQAANIVTIFEDLKNFDVNIKVTGTPAARWAGGPVQSGSMYQVNELGREGFLSASGTLQAIRKPRYGLWRAPSSGTVIPAHIMAGLSVPAAGVKVDRRSMPVPAAKGNNQGLIRALQMSMASRQAQPSGLEELAAVQAQQSVQLGKLGRAVSDLANKDWNVNVGLKVKDNAAYLNALNHRL